MDWPLWTRSDKAQTRCFQTDLENKSKTQYIGLIFIVPSEGDLNSSKQGRMQLFFAQTILLKFKKPTEILLRFCVATGICWNKHWIVQWKIRVTDHGDSSLLSCFHGDTELLETQSTKYCRQAATVGQTLKSLICVPLGWVLRGRICVRLRSFRDLLNTCSCLTLLIQVKTSQRRTL